MKNFRYIFRAAFSFLILVVMCISIFSLLGMSSGKDKVSAAVTNFNPGHIIDDNIFTNSASLSAAQIQVFLNDMVGTCYAPGAKSSNPPNGSCINQYVENTTTLQNNFSNPNASIPGGISAAQIIYDAAQQYSINPEVLLVTMQKEQGLVTDNWPYYSEYTCAMGYFSCSQDSDFYQQVDGAAWQFRHYLNNPGAFNYWIGQNTVDYAPGCGGSTVNIENAATAALYIYTPYQPDSNVLNYTNPVGSSSGPGPVINDSCAAYGNRNFWWYFNTWFGSSIDTNVYLAEETGSSTFYVVYDGQKQGIPSLDVLDAWGLEGLPVSSMAPAVFNAIPTAGTVLGRYVQVSQTGLSYFADNGNTYYVSANDAAMWNNFPGSSGSGISATLLNFTNYEGEIKPYASVTGNSTFYAVDNGTLHPITSASTYNLWAGQNDPPIQLSSAYFNTMPISQTDINSPEFTVGSTTYVLSDGSMYWLNSNTTNLVPSSWGGLTINFPLANTFTNRGPLQYMVQASGSPSVYLLDTNGALRGIPDLQTADAFQLTPGGNTSYISSDLLNAFSVGTPASSNIVTIGSNSYVVNSALQSISTSLKAAYNTASNGITLNSAYQNIFPSSSAATPVVQSNTYPGVYYLDAGRTLPFSNPATLGLVAGGSVVTYLTNNALSQFSAGPIMQNYITNGTANYLLDNGNAYTVPSANIANAWNLGQPVTLSSGAVSSYPVTGTLSQYVQIPNGQMCLIDQVAYCAGLAPLVTMWDLNSATLRPSQQLLNSLSLVNTPISPFVSAQPGQPNYGTIYTIAGGHLIGIPSFNAALNLGVANWPVIQLDTATINSLLAGQLWQGYLAEDSSSNIWVLDNGSKHSLPSQYQSSWVGSNTPTVLGTDYLSLLPTLQPIGNAISSSSTPTVYGIKNGERYGFTSPQSYTSSGVATSINVGDSLLQSVPSGGIWTP